MCKISFTCYNISKFINLICHLLFNLYICPSFQILEEYAKLCLISLIMFFVKLVEELPYYNTRFVPLSICCNVIKSNLRSNIKRKTLKVIWKKHKRMTKRPILAPWRKMEKLSDQVIFTIVLLRLKHDQMLPRKTYW